MREIERQAFSDHGYDTGTFLFFLARAHAGFFVALDQDQVIGYLLTRRCCPLALRRRGGIASIAVDAAHRNRGVGRQLLGHALAHLARAGVVEVDLEVKQDNHRAIAFYQRAGFCGDRVLPNYYGRGQHGLRMVIRLDRPGQG